MVKPYREEGSTFESNGKLYDLNIIFVGVEQVPVSTIELSKVIWVLDFVSDMDEGRIERADVSVPILVTHDSGKELVVDGLHRLMKAKRLKLKTLPYKRVSKTLFDYASIPRADHNFKSPGYTKW